MWKKTHTILFFNILCSVVLLCVIVFIALVGSLQLSLMLVLAPFTGSLLDWCGLRNVSFAGGFLFSVGLISASYVNTIYGLFPTFVLIFPVVVSLLNASSMIAPVKCMPSKYHGIACAFVSSSSSAGIFSFSLIITALLKHFH